MPKITPFLWFDTQAEDAMNFYASVFKDSKVLSINRAGGRTMSVETQAEIDAYWQKLTADGGGDGVAGPSWHVVRTQ